MKTSITMYSFHRAARKGTMTVEQFIETAGRLDVEAVDLLAYFWKDEAAEVPQVAGWLKKADLALAAYAVGNSFTRGDEAEWAKNVAVVKKGIEMAARLGAPALRVFGGSLPEGMSIDQAMDRAVRGLKECLPLAERKNVVMAVENHGGLPGTSAELRRLIQALNSPFVRACVDIGNFISVGEDAGPAVEATADLAAHVHIKDLKQFPAESTQGHPAGRAPYRTEGCTVGEGVVPLVRCLKAFKKVGYTGYLSLEYEGTNEDEMAGVEASLTAIRAALDEVASC
jgi:sugar phosphate isomerase/epimerase